MRHTLWRLQKKSGLFVLGPIVSYLVKSYLSLFHLARGGSGQFFCPRVGFRVFRFCLGRVSGQRNLVRVKLGSNFFTFFSQFWQKIGNISQKKLLRVTRVL